MRNIIVLALAAVAFGCDQQGTNKLYYEEGYAKGVEETKGTVDAAKAEAYKAGQIDALTGNIKYRLREHGDHTIIWEPIQNAVSTRPASTVRFRTANDMPYLAPMNDGHGGYLYVPMQELSEKVER